MNSGTGAVSYRATVRTRFRAARVLVDAHSDFGPGAVVVEAVDASGEVGLDDGEPARYRSTGTDLFFEDRSQEIIDDDVFARLLQLARSWVVDPDANVDREKRVAAARKVDFKLSVPALRAAWRADGILARAEADPAAIREGRLEGSEFSRRAGLGWKSLTGRW